MYDADNLNILQDLIAAAGNAGADAADALLVDGRSVSADWRLGKLETLERCEGGDIGLRVLVGQRQAVVSSGDRGAQALADLVERAVAMARAVPQDQWIGLADPDQLASVRPDIDSLDPTELTAERLIDIAAAAEDAARATPGVTNSEGASASWSRSVIYAAASNGFTHSFETSRSGISATALAGDDSIGMERDYDYASRVYVCDLPDPAAIGRRAGERAVRRLNAKSAATMKAPVIFDPRCARGLVGHLCSAINGVSVTRGASFLKDRMGDRVFASGVSIVEDPLRARGLRSSPVDAEGLARRKRRLIDDGVLTTWVLDLGTARQLGLQSTGHAGRAASGPPSPTVANVWLEAGAQSPQDMIRAIKEGLYVTDVFGQGVNGLTGDYSRGCSGFWIRDGEFAGAVNETTIAGNLTDMFKALTPASDLTIEYGTDAPTVRIDGMTIAGTA